MVLKKKEGEWVLVSRDTGRVLRKYGKKKPSKEEVAEDEREIQYFKHKGNTTTVKGHYRNINSGKTWVKKHKRKK